VCVFDIWVASGSKVVDKMKLRFQPNNEEPKARANEKN